MWARYLGCGFASLGQGPGRTHLMCLLILQLCRKCLQTYFLHCHLWATSCSYPLFKRFVLDCLFDGHPHQHCQTAGYLSCCKNLYLEEAHTIQSVALLSQLALLLSPLNSKFPAVFYVLCIPLCSSGHSSQLSLCTPLASHMICALSLCQNINCHGWLR